jgi:hypothetical protein
VPTSSKLSLSLRFTVKIYCTFLTSGMHATYPVHPIVLELVILIIFSKELIIMQQYPASCHFIPLKSEYFLQHPVLKVPSILVLSKVKKLSFTLVQNNR